MTGVSASTTAPARITVIGTTGSGKSHLAGRLAAILQCPAIDLDDQHWLPGWQERSPDDFPARVAALTEAPRWVVAGNYTRVREIVWNRAEMIVWLDYGPVETFRRLLVRTVGRAWSGEVICNGNAESWAELLTSDSILAWYFRSYWKNRRRYGAIFDQPGDWRDKMLLRLKRPRDAEAWFATLGPPPLDPAASRQ